jgi:phosphate-selective porin OprO/OprP
MRKAMNMWTSTALALAAGALGLLAASSVGAASPEAGGAPESADSDAPPNDWRLFWQDGLRLASPQDEFTLKLGGGVQADAGWPAGGQRLADELKDSFDDKAEFRRLRLALSGQLCQNLEYKAEGDFTRAPFRVTDLYLRLTHLPAIGNLTVGHIKEPHGMEHLTSSNNITFLERALPAVFSSRRSFGLMAGNQALDGRMTWAAGVFHTCNDPVWGSTNDGDSWDVTGRVTGLAWYEDDGKRLLHLGASYGLRIPGGPVRFQQRPEAFFMPRFTDTKEIDADSVHRLGVEAAWVDGPLSVQGEYLAAACGAPSASNPWLHGAYAQASYLLTGETRPYDRASGTFAGVRPRKNLCENGGGGAWEVAARCSFVGLNQGELPASARAVQDFTFGLNWYLNLNVRVMWNYIHSWVAGTGVDGGVDTFAMRFQIAF